MPELAGKELSKYSILVKGMLAPHARLTKLGVQCVPMKYNMHNKAMEFKVKFRNGRDLTAKSEEHLNSDEFYAACLMLYDLPPPDDMF